MPCAAMPAHGSSCCCVLRQWLRRWVVALISPSARLPVRLLSCSRNQLRSHPKVIEALATAWRAVLAAATGARSKKRRAKAGDQPLRSLDREQYNVMFRLVSPQRSYLLHYLGAKFARVTCPSF